jgi:hypothetical protein
MRLKDQPEIVTVVACPPADVAGPTQNPFIDEAFRVLTSKKASHNQIIRAASVRDLDVQLSEITKLPFRGTIKLQIVGHSLSGILSLGGFWTPDCTYGYPFYVLDTTPTALGLLAKYAGKFSEVMLVGCNIGSAASFGYAINGRTLTYTLAELLQCAVRGADDIVSPDEFDEHGWYAPGPRVRRPKGWRWVQDLPPTWIDPGTDVVVYQRARTVISFEVRAITATALPVHRFSPIHLDPAIPLACKQLDGARMPTALPEVSVETDHGPADLLCGGRFLRIAQTYYAVERHAKLSDLLTEQLWKTSATPAARAAVAAENA